jgi:hypothetical protein
MGLERRGTRTYYYEKARRGGRVVSRYVGGGELAILAREVDRLLRQERDSEWLDEAIRVEDIEAGDRLARAYFDAVEAVARAAVEAAGYRRHNPGEWRKRRARRDD